MRVKEECEKAGLKFNVKKTKIMASGPITSWQIQGGKVEAVTDFIFLGSEINENSDCTHEIKLPCETQWKEPIEKEGTRGTVYKALSPLQFNVP